MLEAVEMAIRQRWSRGEIRHSDHESKYTLIAFGQRCREEGVRPSMGLVGDCYDNALCESFFATLECELLGRRMLDSRAKARLAVFKFIKALRWIPPSLLGGGKRRFAGGESWCYDKLHGRGEAQQACGLRSEVPFCLGSQVPEIDTPRGSG